MIYPIYPENSGEQLRIITKYVDDVERIVFATRWWEAYAHAAYTSNEETVIYCRIDYNQGDHTEQAWSFVSVFVKGRNVYDE